MQTQTTVTLVWNDAFEAFLRNDYKRVSPTHHTPSAATVKTACQHIRVFGLWFESQFNEEFQPEKITNYALRLYQRTSLETTRVAPNTWNNRLWALGIFSAWIEAQYGSSFTDLMNGMELKEQGIRPSKYRSLSEKEIHDVMQMVERNVRGSATVFENTVNVRDQAIITLALNAGLRVAELSALDVSDIIINERSGSVRVRNGKGNKERIVPLNVEARNALAGIVGNSSATALFVAARGGERLTVRSIERTVSDVCASAGIAGATPHWLRFTFAKSLERKGVAVEMIRDLLGHESIETTRRYLRSSFDELQSVVDRL